MSKTVQVARFTADGSAVSREFQKMGVDGKAGLSKIQEGAKGLSPALRAVDEAAHLAKDRVGEFAHEAGPLGRILSAIGPAGVAVAAGLGVTILAFERLKDQTRDAVRELGEIYEQSERLATSTTFLQEWRFAALGVGRSAQDADSAIAAFATRLGQVSSEIGRTARKGLLQLGFSNEQILNLRSIEEVLPEIADRLHRVESATERMAIARKLGLDPLLPVLSRGRVAFDEAAKAAHDMGYILDEELLHHAAEFNGQWAQAAAVIDVQFKSSLIDLAPVFISLTRVIAESTRAIVEFQDQFKQLEARASHTLADRLDEIGRARESLRLAFPSRNGVDPLAGGDAEAGANAARRGGVLGLDVLASHLSVEQARNRIAFLNEQAAEITRELNSRARNEPDPQPRRETEDTTAAANALQGYVDQLRQELQLRTYIAQQQETGSKATREEMTAAFQLTQDLDKLRQAREQGVIASDDELQQLEESRRARDAEAAATRRQAAELARLQSQAQARNQFLQSLESPIERINREIAELQKQEGVLLTHDEVARGVARLQDQYRDLAAAQREASFEGQVLNGIFQGQVKSIHDVLGMLLQLAANSTLQELLASGVGGPGGIGGFFGRVGDRIANGLTGGDRGLAGLGGLFGGTRRSGDKSPLGDAADEAARALRQSLAPSAGDAGVKLGIAATQTAAENVAKGQATASTIVFAKATFAAATAAAEFAAAAKADQAKGVISDILSSASGGGGKGGVIKGAGKAGGGALIPGALHPYAEAGPEIGVFGGWGHIVPNGAIAGLALIADLAKRVHGGAAVPAPRQAPVINVHSSEGLDVDVSHDIGAGGEDVIDLVVSRKLSGAIGKGKADSAMRARYGATRTRIKR